MARKFNSEEFNEEPSVGRGSRSDNRRPSRRSNDERTPKFRPKRKFDDDDHTPKYRSKGRFDDNEERESRPRRSAPRGGAPARGERRFDKSDRPGFGRGDRRRPDKADDKRPRRRNVTAESEILTEIVNKRKMEGRQTPRKQKILTLEYEEQHGPIRLNKYIANAGICSRRDADVLIASGAITVNGEVVTEMGHKVLPTDEVRYGDKVLQREKPVYVLLNKPKDYITTTDDEHDRANVMELVRDACAERIYPVGRLDRDTTGLLLFTNDGDLTKKLTHPSSQIEKTYLVELDKPFASIDMAALRNGIELADGVITPDDVQYVEGADSKKEVGITIHSGKNRIIRRMFEYLGYEVVKLDRVVFAGLTKKDLRRGMWRFLTKNEISFLKMISKKKQEE
ncbi:MAG: pseudouridine synthase [Bacteroidales bacterium]|nr:pseudouridine synthase [Bacteroidales bacterium]